MSHSLFFRMRRVSLRAVLILTCLTGMSVGLYVKSVIRQKGAAAWVQRTGGSTVYRGELGNAGTLLWWRLCGRANMIKEPVEPVWLSKLLGKDYVSPVVAVSLCETNVQDVGELTQLPQLEFLHLAATNVSDLNSIRCLSNLRYLNLSQVPIRDLSFLGSLRNLEWLALSCANIDDLDSLHKLTNLQNLYVSDLGTLSPLASLESLKNLTIVDSRANDLSPLAGLMRLEVLELRRLNVRNLNSLSGLVNLRVLILEDLPVADLSPITNLRSLDSLTLWNTEVRDLSGMTLLPTLEFLEVESAYVTEREICDLRQSLPGCTVLTSSIRSNSEEQPTAAETPSPSGLREVGTGTAEKQNP